MTVLVTLTPTPHRAAGGTLRSGREVLFFAAGDSGCFGGRPDGRAAETDAGEGDAGGRAPSIRTRRGR